MAECTQKLKVYEWRGMQIIAHNKNEARSLLNDELGVRFGKEAYQPKRAKGPFRLCSFHGDDECEVSEGEYCEKVATFGGGIVKEL